MTTSHEQSIAAITLRVAAHPLYPQLQAAFYEHGKCHIDIELWVTSLCRNFPLSTLPDWLDTFVERQTHLRILASDPWHSIPQFPTEDWKHEVVNGDTRLGYSEWVEHKMEDTE